VLRRRGWGQAVAELGVGGRAEELRLIVPPGQGAASAGALGRYAVMDDFTAELLSDTELLAVHGPASERRLRAAGVALPEGLLSGARWANAEVDGLFVVREKAAGAAGIWLFGSAGALGEIRQRLASAGVPEIGAAEAEVLRLQAGEPRYGAEITDDYFPMEVGLGSAIDYAKGCFLGQEPIVRVRDRGHLNYRLARLVAEGEGELSAGDRLETDQKPKAGRVTSAGRLPGQRAVALALVHVTVPAGAVVRVRREGAADVAPVPARVEAVPDES
jgi:folate-binding protein YgfZ